MVLASSIHLTAATTGVLFVIRAAEYCLSPAGRRKVTERVPGEERLVRDASPLQKFIWGFSDAVELAVSQRGVGWDFGTGEGLRVPPMQLRRPVHDRPRWLATTFARDILINYLVVDLVSTWWRSLPEISSPDAAVHKPFASLSLGLRVALPVSVMLTVSTLMPMWYSMAGFLDVAILGRAPESWPVLFGEPVSRPPDSLSHPWAKRLTGLLCISV